MSVRISSAAVRRVSPLRALQSPVLHRRRRASFRTRCLNQAQILNLCDCKKFGLTYLFISHDLNVIRYLADAWR
jgi:hypothetical protein